MPKNAKALTDSYIRSLKPEDKRRTIGDETIGLHLDIMPSGRKFWRLRYTKRDGKKSWFTIGEYPAISIKEARKRVPYLFQRVRDGLPLKDAPEPDMTFETFAQEWAKGYAMRGRSEISNKRAANCLNAHILPALRGKDIRKITSQDILSVMQKLADDGKFSTMNYVRTFISQIFKFAGAHGAVNSDPSYMVIGAIQARQPRHYATLRRPVEIAELLRAIDKHSNTRVRSCTLFAIYSLSRPGEARRAEWSEIDLDRCEWRVPQEKMKMGRAHIVPLSNQLISIIEAMRPMTGEGRYIFPNTKSGDAPLDKMSMRLLLDAVGFTKEKISPHGFRAMASTILNENGFNSDWIERQLAHVEGNRVRAAYNYADFLDDRRKMLQWYADYLDELRGGKMNLG